MKDRQGRTIRLNEGVDPGMLGIEYADTKQGNHMYPGRRLRYMQRDLERARSLGQIARRYARRIRSRPTAA